MTLNVESACQPVLAGKLALVTGGASGIGAGIADLLAESGAEVVIADRDGVAASLKAAEMTAAGHRVRAIATTGSNMPSKTVAGASPRSI